MSNINNDTVSIKGIVGRAKRVAEVKTDKELSEIIGISKGDFGNRKKRGTLLPLLVKWAANENVDLNFLITGKVIGGSAPDPDPEIIELIESVRRVITSGNLKAINTLKQNVNYLEHSIEEEKKQQEENEAIRKELTELKKQKCEDGKHCPGEQSQNEKAA
ncbi:helix-turn-helix domain-containing protein [Desulfocapsa sp. AH-315-G09]|uniref:Helix-turn-helix domain-containing protein n=1 Tax=Desulfotalea psychrophila TaxID=84980 RepID=A0ABS3ATJ8_9BACT|nr:helix-turn-helix domain-containing protein [Desulfocapsa sp.]MBL4904428.1 helix-turn-helix domain-containing protein [Desulfocapsa sp.]MBN4045997.1 helix-turn-helix domain-containing protein [bacterium AH-315-P11]MBN4065305.1 helix-turn-helix domain-containing protein [Desulfocapsa sp. AH-315-G09]MBN4068435.1 helix-turn-helix domain-containing protein [Desulfotalea psychrophila]